LNNIFLHRDLLYITGATTILSTYCCSSYNCSPCNIICMQ